MGHLWQNNSYTQSCESYTVGEVFSLTRERLQTGTESKKESEGNWLEIPTSYLSMPHVVACLFMLYVLSPVKDRRTWDPPRVDKLFLMWPKCINFSVVYTLKQISWSKTGWPMHRTMSSLTITPHLKILSA